MSKIFGENLKEIRKSAGLRQWELSIRPLQDSRM